MTTYPAYTAAGTPVETGEGTTKAKATEITEAYTAHAAATKVAKMHGGCCACEGPHMTICTAE